MPDKLKIIEDKVKADPSIKGLITVHNSVSECKCGEKTGHNVMMAMAFGKTPEDILEKFKELVKTHSYDLNSEKILVCHTNCSKRDPEMVLHRIKYND